MAQVGLWNGLTSVGAMSGNRNAPKVRLTVAQELTWELLPVVDIDSVGVEGDVLEAGQCPFRVAY